MRKIEATFRIVTPLFMSGADQQKVELRVPSIKGALRFWWRALALGRLGSVERVKEEEARLFGSSDQKIGQSKVLLNIFNQKVSKETIHKWRPNAWQTYVGYGIIETKRECIKAGSSFILELVLKNDVTETDEEMIHLTLKAMGLIGGIGAHSRNGWGSLSLINLTEWKTPTTLLEYQSELATLLSGGKVDISFPDYSAFSNETRITIGVPGRNSEAVHRSLAENYKDYISNIRPKNHRMAFGLPRKPDNISRRASPVFLHVHEIGNEYVPVVSFFPAKFLPDRHQPPSGYDQIHSFLDQFTQGAKQ